jgi:hypothetical protein
VLAQAAFLPIELLRIVSITSLYALAISGWGSLVCRHLLTGEESLADFVAARCVAGCFGLYAVFIALSAVGWLRPVAIAIVWATGLMLAVFQVRPWIPPLRLGLRQMSDWTVGQRLLLVIVCFLVVLQIACGLTPLTFYDSQVYLLLAPVQFLKAGRLSHIPWNVLTNGPMALQLTFGMSWIADTTGGVFKLLMTGFGCLAVLAAARIGSETGTKAAIVSAMFVAVYPEFWIHQTFGVVDLTIAAFIVFGTVWWLEALRKRGWKSAILPGMALGFATASRYQGAVLVPWIIAGTFTAEWIRNPKLIPENVKKGLVVAAIVVAMVLPWLLRNYYIFGNPVFPLLPGLLGGAEWSVEQAKGLHQEVMGPTLIELPPRQIPLAPINALLMFPSNGLLGIVIFIGGLIVAFWPGASGKALGVYATLGLGGVIIWGLIHPSPRVQLLRFNAASVIFLLACTGALLGSERFNRWKGTHIATILALGSVLIAIIGLSSLVRVLPVLSTSNARGQLWQANVPSWRVMEFANNSLDPVRHKVLFIGETRAVWLKTPFIAPSALNGAQLLELFSPNADPAAWTERLHRLGVTHILICSSEWQRLADGYGYFRLSDEHLSRFYQWLHTLPLVFDDHHGNVLLSV